MESFSAEIITIYDLLFECMFKIQLYQAQAFTLIYFNGHHFEKTFFIYLINLGTIVLYVRYGIYVSINFCLPCARLLEDAGWCTDEKPDTGIGVIDTAPEVLEDTCCCCVFFIPAVAVLAVF